MTVADLIKLVREMTPPDGPFRLSGAEVIQDPKKFIQSHISIIEANYGKELSRPYAARLNKFYKLCSK